MNWKKTGVLITGGTGSFGKAFARELLRRHRPRVVRIFSRDELKQHQMQEEGISGPTLTSRCGPRCAAVTPNIPGRKIL